MRGQVLITYRHPTNSVSVGKQRNPEIALQQEVEGKLTLWRLHIACSSWNRSCCTARRCRMPSINTQKLTAHPAGHPHPRHPLLWDCIPDACPRSGTGLCQNAQGSPPHFERRSCWCCSCAPATGERGQRLLTQQAERVSRALSPPSKEGAWRERLLIALSSKDSRCIHARTRVKKFVVELNSKGYLPTHGLHGWYLF